MLQKTFPAVHMIVQLQAAILQLPEAIAFATHADALAWFSGDQVEESSSSGLSSR
jgi:hypothetical protein